MNLFKVAFVAGLLLPLSCFNSGCLMPASYIAGYSNPKMKVHLNKLSGALDAEIGTDFTGKVLADFDPTTKKAHIEAEVSSKASDVNISEAEKAKAIAELQMHQMDTLAAVYQSGFALGGQIASLAAPILAQRPGGQQQPQPGINNAELIHLIEGVLDSRGIPRATPAPPN